MLVEHPAIHSKEQPRHSHNGHGIVVDSAYAAAEHEERHLCAFMGFRPGQQSHRRWHTEVRLLTLATAVPSTDGEGAGPASLAAKV